MGNSAGRGLRAQLFRRKPTEMLLAEAEAHDGGLKRALGALDLTALGIGAIIGAGIFVLTGVAAARYAGPAISLSFVVAGFACAMAALCYAEFASMIPIAGSAYSYSYATMGELVGWIIGWDLVLEYAVGAAAVAVGWSGYLNVILQGLGIHLPVALDACARAGRADANRSAGAADRVAHHRCALRRNLGKRAAQFDNRRDQAVRDCAS